MLLSSGKIDASISVFEKAVSADAGISRAHFYLGFLIPSKALKGMASQPILYGKIFIAMTCWQMIFRTGQSLLALIIGAKEIL